MTCPWPWAVYMYKIVKSLNAFISKTAWIVFPESLGSFCWSAIDSFQMVPHHLNNMSAIPIPYLKVFFSRTEKTLRLSLDIQYRGLKVYQICSSDDIWMAFALFTARSKCWKSRFLKMFYTYGWNLQCLIQVVKHFSFNQTSVPQGIFALAPGLYIYV